MAGQKKLLSAHRLVFLGTMLLPALLTQTVAPLVPTSTWEEINDSLYSVLTAFKSSRAKDPSAILVLTSGAKDQANVTPVDTGELISLLGRLKEAGRPYVLSLDSILPAQGSALGPDYAKSVAMWAKAVREYQKFIGSPLDLIDGDAAPDPDLEALIGKVAFTKDGTAPSNLGEQPIQISEARQVVAGEKIYGFSTRFDTAKPVVCFQPYIGDQYGELAIPTSILWATTFFTQANMILGNGAVWPRKGEKVEFSFQRSLVVGDRQCVADAATSTADFLASRSISVLTVSDFLQSPPSDLKSKLIVLAVNDGSQVQGPGTERDSAITPQYLLQARFLDGLVTGDSIRRPDLTEKQHFAWLPILLALILATMSFFFGNSAMIGFVGTSFGLLFVYVQFQLLANDTYIVPIQAMASTALSTSAAILTQVFLRIHGKRRMNAYGSKLDKGFADCNSLEEINATAVRISREEFQIFELGLTGYNKAAYQAAATIETAVSYVSAHGSLEAAIQPSPFQNDLGKLSTVLTTVKRPPDAGRLALGSRGITTKIAIISGDRRIGTAEILLSYRSHEEVFVADLINAFQKQLAKHWGRIDAEVRQRLQKASKGILS